MISSKLKLMTLGSCIVMLALVTMSTGEARAEATANWKVNGSNVSSTLKPGLSILELENNTMSALLKIGGAEVAFLCTGAELTGAKLETEGSLTGGTEVKFTGCVTLLNEEVSAACTPRTGGQPYGSLLTNQLKGLLVLHEGTGLLRVEPNAGETFTTLQFGEECFLPEVVPVRGQLLLKDCKGELQTELVEHLVEQGPLTHVFAINDTAEHAMVFDGSALVALSGAHTGLKWSGLPA